MLNHSLRAACLLQIPQSRQELLFSLSRDRALKHQGTELPLQHSPEPTAGACRTHIKDLEACNVQHPDEELPGQFGVQGPVDPGHQPLEHAIVGGFSQGPHSIEHLPRQTQSTQ